MIMLSMVFSSCFILFFSNWGSILMCLMTMFFMLMCTSYEFFIFKINSLLECDGLSMTLVILSIWLIILSFLASSTLKNKNISNIFIFVLNSLLFFLIISFSLNNYILFYLSFECSILPITFLIIGWGYQPERTQAGIYLIFYTLFASLPLLVMILVNSYFNGSCMCLSTYYFGMSSGVFNIILFGAFLVKFPMYLTHLWLPKAHVEAPVAGSMILAGILLKLGGYGMMRFMNSVSQFPDYILVFLIILSISGGVLISFVCMNHMDMKSLVAYSSVVHMSTCICCILVMNELGFQGAFIMMIAHGLSSSGLFFLIGLIYERTGSRNLMVNKGLMNIMPSMAFVWFMVVASNMSAPPFINLLSEINIICSLLNWSGYLFIMLSLLVFFSACYNLYLFSLSQHGKYLFSKQSFHSGFNIEYMVGLLHFLPLLMLILYIGYLN
uniref:NADH-ubiquinone oxidoreductase chain 4 n=1 Tax=Ampithoe lacertosa TaxID=429030 RepID=A0A5P9W7V2_9CRUS|nr:NADH dehydrogenase subunit 4 [Ampithoe lacertosa]QFX74903.1 NADH dehydrogenase subunit 4 [Ampithoe lacertosa]